MGLGRVPVAQSTESPASVSKMKADVAREGLDLLWEAWDWNRENLRIAYNVLWNILKGL